MKVFAPGKWLTVLLALASLPFPLTTHAQTTKLYTYAK
jgi:hypothetical protein